MMSSKKRTFGRRSFLKASLGMGGVLMSGGLMAGIVQAKQAPADLETRDYIAKLNLTDLPSNQEIFYRVQFQSLEDITVFSEPLMGHFRTAPVTKRDISR